MMARRESFDPPPERPVAPAGPDDGRPRGKKASGKHSLSILLDAASWEAIRALQFETNLTKQNLGVKALNLLMREHGKPATLTYGERLNESRGYSVEAKVD